MKDKIISWAPLLVVLAILISFKIFRFANHHYSIFLVTVILCGFFLVLTARALHKRSGPKEAVPESEARPNQ